MVVDILNHLASQLAQPFAQMTREAEPTYIHGAIGSSLSLILSSIYRESSLLVVMEDADEAGYMYSDLEQILGDDRVLLFPSAFRRSIKYGHRDDANVLLRSMVLSAMTTMDKQSRHLPLIVTYPEALAEAVVERTEAEHRHIILNQGQHISQEEIIEHLHAWGYERTDYVYEPGQYALRGSILDVYSYASERPYRLDFWGDEIESMRTFDIETQLSIARHTTLTLVPDLGMPSGNGSSLLELLSSDTILVASDATYLGDRLEILWNDPPRINDGEGFDTIEEVRTLLVSPERTLALAGGFRHIYNRASSSSHASSHLRYELQPQPIYGKAYEQLTHDIMQWQSDGYTVYISAAQQTQYQRIVEILEQYGASNASTIHIPHTLHEGFVDKERRIVLLTEHQVFGRYHKYNLKSDKARSGKITLSLKELSTFSLGDLVVHSEHGIGRFGGLLTMDLGGRAQEVVKIEYNRGDTIYVNLHSLHKLSHYRQSDTADGVKLSTIGSGAWQRLKDKTKKHVKDIARDLIRLYAQRRDSQGFAYSADTYLQHELEASFPYEDTPDQATANEAIKADMERPYPMDRLLCGDVGFGKTEMAVRAAFKAATDGKQVALLVPTTVLAYQHYRTFKRRLDGFPVRVDYISRARTATQMKAILSDLKDGNIDIIIGTHRLTSKDVKFKDLGLLIIDEEQKFGVATKEKLRKLQVSVDTLTMSATPIPRTLQFSLMGARDLSNINTPPPNRQPIETILTRFTAESIAEAVNFELSRNGQVYFVHNRIQNIEEVASVIRREVPDARIAIGHGQMAPSELEQILIDFGNHDYDVLVATTIIENGIDVPNANTIMINDAHRYGLSELHQLRGRVGRSDRKAFCYLLTPPIATLSEQSRRRVRAIESFSDLGSGVRIALQDLDIRGAGNALGAEQSGFITDMGYETYQKVFNEAVRELKAEEFADLYQDSSDKLSASRYVVETQVESDLELSLPSHYVPTDAERIILYRELDDLSTDTELSDYRLRLVDRFGEPPAEVDELIAVPRLRRLGHYLGIEKIMLRSGLMSLHLPSDTKSGYYQSEALGRLLEYVGHNSRRCEFRQRNGRNIIRINGVESVAIACQILDTIVQS